MAVLKGGVNGPFSGRVGSVVGSSWRKINYIKGFRRIKDIKPVPSAKQAVQQQKFKLLNSFFMYMEEMLGIGFGQYTDRCTARNAAFRYNYDHAFVMDDGELKLNYAKLAFSRGALYTAGAEKAWPANGEIKVSWNTKTYGVDGQLDDVGYAIAYFPRFDLFEGSHALRHVGEVTFTFFKEFVPGDELHIWLFFADSKKKRASRTVYIPLTEPAP